MLGICTRRRTNNDADEILRVSRTEGMKTKEEEQEEDIRKLKAQYEATKMVYLWMREQKGNNKIVRSLWRSRVLDRLDEIESEWIREKKENANLPLDLRMSRELDSEQTYIRQMQQWCEDVVSANKSGADKCDDVNDEVERK
jgi:hypothetical protein